MTLKQESDLLIMSMTADQIEQHEVLLPINQNYDEIWERKKVDFSYTFSLKGNSKLSKMHNYSTCTWHILYSYTGMTCQLSYYTVQ